MEQDAQNCRQKEKKAQSSPELIVFEDNVGSQSIVLIIVITFQMGMRCFVPEYTCITDGVINIFTTGVFVEIFGVVATVAYSVWKEPNSSDQYL
jgi:hypothetical protein